MLNEELQGFAKLFYEKAEKALGFPDNGKEMRFVIGNPLYNPYWENICKIAEKQRNKGITTYGCGIEDNPADIVTRIEYLQEELIDALMYCEWIKDNLRKE